NLRWLTLKDTIIATDDIIFIISKLEKLVFLELISETYDIFLTNWIIYTTFKERIDDKKFEFTVRNFESEDPIEVLQSYFGEIE
ncbi:17678_t:CDS:1, partial [Cetraspora pellucida]